MASERQGYSYFSRQIPLAVLSAVSNTPLNVSL
jgi:hypothetical protein